MGRLIAPLHALAVAVGLMVSPLGYAATPWALLPAWRHRVTVDPALAAKPGLAAPWTKVGRPLREIVAGVDMGVVRTGRGMTSATDALGLRADQLGRVRVTVRVSSLTATQSALLRAHGLDVTHESARYGFVEGWSAATAVEGLAGLDFVTSVQPTLPPITNTGDALTQGDAILRADQAHQAFGVTGQGVTVGVVSDSVDGIETAIASGDVPAGVQVLQAGEGTGEGTAMLEIVHDLAPGASLAFYGPDTSGDMIAGIRQLAAAGASVIVDDLTFLDQPHFEEGPIAQAVNELATQGVVYVTSAGNFASANVDRGHYEAVFEDAGALSPFSRVHRFAPGVVKQSITVQPGSVGRIFLQWADPFGHAADDYDLYVVDGSNRILAKSDDIQDGDDLPVEQLFIDGRHFSSPVRLFVVIQLFSGSARRLELYYVGGITAISPAIAAGSIAGHANAAGAITVGTINAGNPGAGDIAGYSSQGPCDLFFPLPPETRAKPDITGIDGVAVTGAAGFPKTFFGTSAAAPHIAALAALLQQANPALSPVQVKEALQSSAVDLGAVGFDYVFGAGRADAVAAVSAATGVAITSTTSAAGSSTTSTTSATATNTPTTLAARTVPRITSLSAVLDANTVTLSGSAAGPDADVVGWRVRLYDGGGTPLGDTGVGEFPAALAADGNLRLDVPGLEHDPTATAVGLVLQDAVQQVSVEVRADFGQGDAGGPRIASAVFRAKARTLTLVGGGLVAGATRVEVNGTTLPRAAKVTRSGARAAAHGAARRLNLRPGPNRIRLLVGGLRSNIVVLDR